MTYASGARPADLPLRQTSRVILADDRDRILLFRFVDAESDTPGGTWWATPGGGVDEGESLPQAASRELFEETGLRVPATGFDRVVARAGGATQYRGRREWYEHVFYFLRAGAFEVDKAHWTEVERSMMVEFRWWTAAELAATAETIYPPGLARILPELLAGHLPVEPFDVNSP